MTQSAKFKHPHEIKRGDIIDTPLSNKLGLVYDIENETGMTTSFNIIPIHIHTSNYHGKNDEIYFMLPKGVKNELGLDDTKNYQVEFKLENILIENTLDFVIRHAQTTSTGFGQETLRRMEVNDFRTHHPELYKTPEEKIHSIHNQTPSFVKERQKPSAGTELNITVEDAAQLGLICKTVRDVLSYGTYNRGQSVPFLREAYKASISTNPKDYKKMEQIFRSSVGPSNLTLDEACQSGLLKRGKTSPTVWERKGILKVSDALEAIQNSGKTVSKINPQVIEHIETFPVATGLPTLLQAAWSELGRLYVRDDPKLYNSGKPFMYPIHERK